MVRQLGCLFQTHHCRKSLQGVKIPEKFVEHTGRNSPVRARRLNGKHDVPGGSQVFFRLCEVVVEKLIEERLARRGHCVSSRLNVCSRSASGSKGFVKYRDAPPSRAALRLSGSYFVVKMMIGRRRY